MARGGVRRGRAAGLAGLAVLAVLLASGPGCTTPEGTDGLPSRVRQPVRLGAQERSLSCESRSAVDLLGWWGIDVPEAVFLRGLPRSDNPDRGFVGDVDGPGGRLPPAGYGVHAEPVAARLRNLGLEARAARGAAVGRLREEVARGRPVIVWATARLEPGAPVAQRDHQGRPFTAVAGQHTYLVIGYGPGVLELGDPATGERVRVARARFEASWAALGRQAVFATARASPGCSPK
jgi:uncharacterized protein YvpB